MRGFRFARVPSMRFNCFASSPENLGWYKSRMRADCNCSATFVVLKTAAESMLGRTRWSEGRDMETKQGIVWADIPKIFQEAIKIRQWN
jgi:hypothetical protein